MTNEELEKEIALWKRATGYDNPEDLDSFLGRAGVLNQFDVLNKMLADANKEKEQLRALLAEVRRWMVYGDRGADFLWDLQGRIDIALLKTNDK
jgi:hypothetical protein